MLRRDDPVADLIAGRIDAVRFVAATQPLTRIAPRRDEDLAALREFGLADDRDEDEE